MEVPVTLDGEGGIVFRGVWPTIERDL